MKSMPEEGDFDNRHLSETGRLSNFAVVAAGIAGSVCPGGRASQPWFSGRLEQPAASAAKKGRPRSPPRALAI
jgi:hypothetical protein